MDGRSPAEVVDAFHLLLLRALETALPRESYVVKGGVNLRAWFGSPRFSEDLDLDVGGLARSPLAERVDRALAGRTLAILLRSQSLHIERITKPKQTDTTQRWKLAIRCAESGLAVPTRIEFSRRDVPADYVFEPVLAEVVRPYGIPRPAANHYRAAAAIRQKIRALAHRSETQARDIWDLDHLFRTTRADARPLTADLSAALPLAAHRVMAVTYEVFTAQVLAYVAPDHRELLGTPEAWERMRELVLDELLRLAR